GAIFHSDHGAQYASKAFAQLCAQWGVTQSMGAVGTSADNALAESFNATLKRETLRGGRTWPDPGICARGGFRGGTPPKPPPPPLLVRPASPDHLRAAARPYAAARRVIEHPVSTIR